MYELAAPGAGKTKRKEIVLYAFSSGTDGALPMGGVILDANGNLFGTTFEGGAAGNFGTVYELAPQAGGKVVTETILYAFGGGSDGAAPAAGLLEDAQGNLYGTTEAGGAAGDGTVFTLARPANGLSTWKEVILYSFAGGNDGAEPQSALVWPTHRAICSARRSSAAAGKHAH